MVAAAATASSQLLFSSSRSFSRLSPYQICVFDSKCPSSVVKGRHVGVAAGVWCMAFGTTSEVATKRRSSYQIETLTNWLLQQEQSGVIDAELTIVLSSISTACKQIASLVQRAGISNLTGIQGAATREFLHHNQNKLYESINFTEIGIVSDL